MSDSRVWFPGNPWADDGHAVKTFNWTAETFEGDVWFLFRLETENYNVEEASKPVSSGEASSSSWEQPEAWEKFDRSLLNSEDGFCVGPLDDYDADDLDGRTFAVDPLPLEEGWEPEDLIFQSYILGHDSVADHRITLTSRLDSDNFDIDWTCKVALTYSGETEFRHGFHATIKDIAAPAPKPMEVPID